MKTLRWIGVLPIALITVVLSSIIIKYFLILTGQLESDSIILLIIISIHSCMFFILAGIQIAPSHKRETALGLLIIGILLSIGNIITAYNYYPKQFETFRFWVNNLTGILGLIIGYLWVKEKYKQDSID